MTGLSNHAARLRAWLEKTSVLDGMPGELPMLVHLCLADAELVAELRAKMGIVITAKAPAPARRLGLLCLTDTDAEAWIKAARPRLGGDVSVLPLSVGSVIHHHLCDSVALDSFTSTSEAMGHTEYWRAHDLLTARALRR